MDPDELLEALRREGTALAAAAARGGLAAPVPSCPGWDVGRVVEHLGRVHRRVTAMVRGRSQERVELPPRPPVVDREWFEEGLTELAAALEEAGPDAPVWTFPGGSGTARFWFRRQALETALHRWDVEASFGAPSPVETELALAGIDEVLDVLLASRRPDLGGSVHLHATDSPHGEWIVREGDDALLVGHGHERADVALRATAGELLLWLWGRDVPEARLEIFGDRSILERWSAQMKIG